MEDVNMEKKNMKFVEVTDFIHLGGTSDEIVNNFKRLMESGIIDIDKIKLVTINYTMNVGNVESGPVHIYFSSGVELWLDLTAGYNGIGPSNLCKILKICKVTFKEDDILSSNSSKVVLRYVLKDNYCYQFKKHDGNYEYTM